MGVFFSKADPERDRSALAPKLWALWTKLTRSTYDGGVPNRFSKAVGRALESGYHHSDLSNAIHYAAFLKPTTIRSDVTRVAKVLEDFEELDRLKALAVQLTVQNIPLEEYMSGPILFYPGTEAEETEDVSLEDVLKSSFSSSPGSSKDLKDLAETLGVSLKYWTEYEYAFALSILEEKPNPKELKEALSKTRRDISQFGVLPSDLVRTLSGVRFSRELNTLDEDDEEDALPDASYLQLDKRVVALIQTGEFYYDRLLAVHHDVPIGFWERVSREAEDFSSLSLDEIYSRVQTDFDGFHPDNREALLTGEFDE